MSLIRLPILTVSMFALLLADCSHGSTIAQAFDICHSSGNNTSNVSFNAYILSYGWARHIGEKAPSPTSHNRFTVAADLGPSTPLRGFPVRIQDDLGLTHRTDMPIPHVLITLTGTFVCNNAKSEVNDLNGYFVPSKILYNGKAPGS